MSRGGGSPTGVNSLITKIATNLVQCEKPVEMEAGEDGILVFYKKDNLTLTMILDNDYDIIFHSAQLTQGRTRKTLYSSGEVEIEIDSKQKRMLNSMDEFCYKEALKEFEKSLQ